MPGGPGLSASGSGWGGEEDDSIPGASGALKRGDSGWDAGEDGEAPPTGNLSRQPTEEWGSSTAGDGDWDDDSKPAHQDALVDVKQQIQTNSKRHNNYNNIQKLESRSMTWHDMIK